MRGYLNNPTATVGTFVDGWLRTGDLGVVDHDGTLSVQGRIKEQINRGGEKISPEHVERILASHPDVAQAVVFGVADDLYGERIAAVVVTRGHTEPDLAAYSRGRLACSRSLNASRSPMNCPHRQGIGRSIQVARRYAR